MERYLTIKAVRTPRSDSREKNAGVQEEGLGGGQCPAAQEQFLGGDVGASDAQRDDLASQERQDEAPRPQAQEAAPRAVKECLDGGIIDRGPGDELIVGELVLGGKLLGRGFLVDFLESASVDVGHGDRIRSSTILWSLIVGQEIKKDQKRLAGRWSDPEADFRGKDQRSIGPIGFQAY